jgi:hypothetical protein
MCLKYVEDVVVVYCYCYGLRGDIAQGVHSLQQLLIYCASPSEF